MGFSHDLEIYEESAGTVGEEDRRIDGWRTTRGPPSSRSTAVIAANWPSVSHRVDERSSKSRNHRADTLAARKLHARHLITRGILTSLARKWRPARRYRSISSQLGGRQLTAPTVWAPLCFSCLAAPSYLSICPIILRITSPIERSRRIALWKVVCHRNNLKNYINYILCYILLAEGLMKCQCNVGSRIFVQVSILCESLLLLFNTKLYHSFSPSFYWYMGFFGIWYFGQALWRW